MPIMFGIYARSEGELLTRLEDATLGQSGIRSAAADAALAALRATGEGSPSPGELRSVRTAMQWFARADALHIRRLIYKR